MTISLIIFTISLLIVLGILISSARKVERGIRQIDKVRVPDVSFRKIEKYMLYYTKNIVQITVITVVKYSMISAIKTKKIVREKLPHIHNKIKKVLSKKDNKPSFIQKAILESKTKIRRIKDKVKREHQ